MTADLGAATAFLTTHGRVLDRRRLHLLLGQGQGQGDRAAVLSALEAYSTADGGYGWGLEPDLRASESQPAGALHALEVFSEAAPGATSARAVELCDWLGRHTLADGGLPFALPVAEPAGCAPFWAQADPDTSSLQITAQVTALALRLGRHQPQVAGHPWLRTATAYCLRAVDELGDEPGAYELKSALQVLDVLADTTPSARKLLERAGAALPPDGIMHVEGGAEDEVLRPLSFAPRPGRPVRALFPADVIAIDLHRLASQQQPDGGWPVDFDSYSAAAAVEWRGYATVEAVRLLRDNDASVLLPSWQQN